MRRLILVVSMLAAGAAAQSPDRDIEKALEALLKKAAPAKDLDDAKRKESADAFRADVKAFADAWAPRAGQLSTGLWPLGRALLLAGRPGDAVPHLEAFVKRRPDSPDVEEALLSLGSAYLDVLEYEKARTLYETFLKERPESDQATAARYYLAVAHLEAGRVDEGVAGLDAVAASAPQHPLAADARLKVVQALAEAGRAPEARTRLEALLKEAPDGPALQAVKAQLDRLGTVAPALPAGDGWIGGAVDLAAEKAKGRVVVACFFADFYESSQAELSLLADLSRKYADRPVTFVGVTAYYRRKVKTPEEERALLKAFLEERKVLFPVAVAPDFATHHAWGVVAVPHTAVVDRDGRIVHQKIGGSRKEKRSAAALEAALERALR
ncbi:MAG TPA: tetratricopeptide repeat protein [Planctomycetota bacterium]|nr:tetratricopeptide repeat protein [Planctomycetota bacterium]